MLRYAAAKTAQQLTSCCSGSRVATAGRSYATKGIKRALNKAQLEGRGKGPLLSKRKPGPPDSASAPAPPPPPTSAAAPSDGGDNAMPMLVGVGLLAAAGGAYYYYGMELAVEGKGEAPAVTTKDEKSEPEPEKPKTDEVKGEKTPSSMKGVDGGNRVLQIEIPVKEGTRSAPATTSDTVSHPEGGNRVTMESFRQTFVPSSGGVSVEDSLKELKSSIELESSDIMKRANQEIMKSFDETIFAGLDDLTPAQLRTRVVQLATEMKERTKWEALRLKEFLALKEKETADKYLDVLQKQRLEFESILARRLREQEHELATEANAKLLEKDGAVKEMIDQAIEKLGEEHENEKNSLIERTEQEFRTKYERVYMEKLEEFKTKAIDEMERKQQALKALKKKLNDLENALASSRNYHEGSLQAHKLSAAALALAEKMEGNKGAAQELEALKAVAGRDNVIATALSSVPSSITKGVPTLPELQARFEKVANKTRQAALVPAGQSGLEGQLAGMLFATLKFPPKPDDPPPEDDKDAAEYILVRARQHVQYGELEKAIQQLNKLEGQAAFTVEGWKKDATDRVAVEQALKVIKMECALLNETMSNQP